MIRSVLVMGFLLVCLFQPHALAETIIPCDVLIDVGHGGIDGGTSNKGILEKDINLAVARKLYVQLKQNGYAVKLTRFEDTALSDENPVKYGSRHLRDLQRRKWIANAVKPKLFISLHVNWSRKKTYSGPIVLYQKNNKESLKFAEIAQQHLNSVYGANRKTVKGKAYYLLNRLQMPAVIVEMGFMSNPNDLKMLTKEDQQDKISLALSAAIKEYFLQQESTAKELPF